MLGEKTKRAGFYLQVTTKGREKHMNLQDILASCDHTLLTQTASWEQIKAVCDEGIKYQTATVCIPPAYVKQAKDYVGDRLRICTVVGFPNGYNTTACKVFEAQDALQNGADEIDMVINIGELKAGNRDYVRSEIQALKQACGDRLLKVIVETCLLTEAEKITACELVTQAGADFIKTSTGFSTGGASFEDIALFSKHIGPGLRMKAAGGISTLEDAEKFIELGASRLGTSRIVKLARAQEQ